MELSKVHAALVGNGFELLQSSPYPIYSGFLHPKGSAIPIRLHLSDVALVSIPSIELLERPVGLPKVCAHISPNGFLCYLGKDQAYLPRNNIGGAVLGCLELARQLLERLVDGDALSDTRDEFLIYWGGADLLLDIPKSKSEGVYEHFAIVSLPSIEGRDELWVLGDDAKALAARYKFWGGKELFSDLTLRVVNSDTPLGISEEWPPKDLKLLSQWLQVADYRAHGGLMSVLKDAYRLRQNLVLLLIRAPNCSCAVLLDLSIARKVIKAKSADQFMRSALKSYPKNVKVTRLGCVPVDAESWLTRNLAGGVTGLAGKNIALVGCGAIGGYLADLLVKSGAGFLGGSLVLIDDDELSVGNLGRHFLGFEYIGQNKAAALCAELRAKYPEVQVSFIPKRVRGLSSLSQVSLVVDATGNEAFSQYLGESFLSGKLPPIVFSWVIGAGCGAQAYLLHDPKQACIGCLEHTKPGGQLSVMGRDYKMEVKNVGGCGDWLVPFPASAALHAASLAAEISLDWANGVSKPTLRSITLDNAQGKLVKPISPQQRANCEICNPSH